MELSSLSKYNNPGETGMIRPYRGKGGDVTRLFELCLVSERQVQLMARVRIGSIVLRVDNLRRQSEFWAAALDYVPREEQSDDFALLRPRDGVGPNLSLDCVHSEVHVPPRIHLDLYTDDQAGEVTRLIALGATEVHWSKRPPDADYIILADPEGNRFCVVDITR